MDRARAGLRFVECRLTCARNGGLKYLASTTKGNRNRDRNRDRSRNRRIVVRWVIVEVLRELFVGNTSPDMTEMTLQEFLAAAMKQVRRSEGQNNQSCCWRSIGSRRGGRRFMSAIGSRSLG